MAQRTLVYTLDVYEGPADCESANVHDNGTARVINGNVSEKAVEYSLTVVRQWREYQGLPAGPKGKRGRTKHGLIGLADPKALRPHELAED